MPRIAQRTALLLLLLLGVLLGGTGVSARGKEGVADGPDSGGTVNKDVEEQAGDGEDGTPSNGKWSYHSGSYGTSSTLLQLRAAPSYPSAAVATTDFSSLCRL